jgi:hypothetical protein
MTLSLICLIVALVFFALAAFNVPTKINLVAAGLFFATLASVIGGAIAIHG